MIKALQWEAPNLHARWIDVDELSDTTLTQGVLDAEHELLALRQNKWYSPSIHQTLLNQVPSALVTEGVHWITGGTGGLGFALAQYLVSQGVKELLLTSRHGERSELAEPLQALKAQGVTVNLRAVDSSDEVKIKALIAEYGQNITAIYHLAGVEQSGPFMEITSSSLNEVLLPKVAGAALLDKLTQSIPLKHFVLFSSIASTLGSNRQLAYVAANQYLDDLALSRRAEGLPATCINWGPWGEIGMMAAHVQAKTAPGLLSPTAAFNNFWLLIANQKTNITVVNPEYLHFMLSFLPKPYPKTFGIWLSLLEQEAKKQRSQLALDLLSLTPELRQERLITLVDQTIQDILGLSDNPALDKGFFELGIDSLMSIEVGRSLQERLGVTLNPTVVFNYQTLPN